LLNLNTRFEQELHKSIKEQADKLTEELAVGNCQTFEQYKYKTGQIRALYDVIGYHCTEVNKKIAHN
jgi:hypothetical protein